MNGAHTPWQTANYAQQSATSLLTKADSNFTLISLSIRLVLSVNFHLIFLPFAQACFYLASPRLKATSVQVIQANSAAILISNIQPKATGNTTLTVRMMTTFPKLFWPFTQKQDPIQFLFLISLIFFIVQPSKILKMNNNQDQKLPVLLIVFLCHFVFNQRMNFKCEKKAVQCATGLRKNIIILDRIASQLQRLKHCHSPSKQPFYVTFSPRQKFSRDCCPSFTKPSSQHRNIVRAGKKKKEKKAKNMPEVEKTAPASNAGTSHLQTQRKKQCLTEATVQSKWDCGHRCCHHCCCKLQQRCQPDLTFEQQIASELEEVCLKLKNLEQKVEQYQGNRDF